MPRLLPLLLLASTSLLAACGGTEEEKPAAPTSVIASDGTSPDEVLVSWVSARGATSYRVFRDGMLLGVTQDTLWKDASAKSGGPPFAPESVEASDGTFTTHVALSWRPAAVVDGRTHAYQVTALNAHGESAPSATDSGYRAAAAVTSYEVSLDGGHSWVGAGLGTTYEDPTAPLGVLTPGSATASPGLFADRVALSTTGASVARPGVRQYFVRARNAAGEGTSASAQGRRGVDSPAYQWQRSAGESDAEYADLPDARTATAADPTAPASGEPRWYRCVVSAKGAASAPTAAVRGFRSGPPVVSTEAPTNVRQTTLTARGALTTLGTPAATARGLCVGHMAEPALGMPGADCKDAPGPVAPGQFSLPFGTLTPGSTYRVRAYALHPTLGPVYAAPVEVVTVPAAPGGIAATRGSSALFVTVSWNETPGARTYRVYRDGALAGELSTTSFDDPEAMRGGVPAAPTSLAASDGTYTDRVALSWSAPTTPEGLHHQYTVRAANDSGESGSLGMAEGFRAPSPVTGYEVTFDGGATWSAVGTGTDWSDRGAPPGVVEPGAAEASKGNPTTHVAVALPSLRAAPGPGRTYAVRAVNASGAGAWSASDKGYRAAGAFSHQWERSEVSATTGFVALPGATASTLVDGDAPATGESRWYRCVVSAAAAASATSSADRGFRLAPPPTAVSASDGTSADLVSVSWSAAPGATAYRVYRGTILAGQTSGTSFDDLGASAGAPLPPVGASASQALYIDRVHLQWGAAAPQPGGAQTYTVRSVNAGGDGALSSGDSGHRAATPVTGYEVSLDGGATFHAVGAATEYDDPTPPLGTTQPGAASASQGTSATGVNLALTGASASAAPTRTYAVRGVSGTTPGAYALVTGSRRTGVLSYQWQRSSGDAPSGWADLAGATTTTFEDTGAPATGQGRYYRAQVWGEGAAPAVTAAVRGFRRPAPREDLWDTNGTVHALAYANGVLYLGGDFTFVGPPGGSLLALDGPSGAKVTGFPETDGNVFAVAPDGAGGWYVGGDFTRIGGVPRTRLAHVTASGAVDPAWNPGCNDIVWAVAVGSSAVYVGGRFSAVGGQSRERIAALDLVTGAPTAWNPGADSPVFALAVSGGTVYLGGTFTSIRNTYRANIAAVDATTGLLTSWNPGANNVVRALLPLGGVVYAGGAFSTIGGQSRSGLAALSTTTGAATSWNPGPSSSVEALVASGDTLYAGGSFLKVGGQSRGRLAAFDLASGALGAWNPGADFTVSALALQGNSLYAGGAFRLLGGQPREGIGAIDATTGAVTSWSTLLSGNVSALASDGNRVVAGGAFRTNGVARSYLAAIDVVTGSATAWNPGAGGIVRALAVQNGVVYAGGSFTSAGGQSRASLAAIDVTSGQATAWNPGSNGIVSSLALGSGVVYAGGEFSSIGTRARVGLAALDSNTGLATAWNPGTPFGLLSTIAVNGGVVYIGGEFDSVGSVSRSNLAAIDAFTGQVTSWNPFDTNDVVSAIAPSGSLVYVGGSFTRTGLQNRNRLAALNTTSGSATAWNPGVLLGSYGGSVRALVVAGGVAYVGGDLGTAGGQYRDNVAAIDTSSGIATAWDPSANGTVHAIVVAGGTVYLGGAFSRVGGTAHQGLAAVAQ